MIYIIIGILCWLKITCSGLRYERLLAQTLFDFIFSVFFDIAAGVFVGFMFGLMAYVMIGGIICDFFPKKEIVEEYDLYEYEVSSDGIVSYAIETDNGIHIEKENIENIFIRKGASQTVKIHKIEFRHDWYKWFAFPLFDKGYVELYLSDDTKDEFLNY